MKKLTPKKLKALVEAYERINAIEQDIKSITDLAEKSIDNKGNAWISIDLESVLMEEMQQNVVPTETGYTMYYGTVDTNQKEDGLTIDIPDTVLLEVLGVLLRHKQQLLNHESNNI